MTLRAVTLAVGATALLLGVTACGGSAHRAPGPTGGSSPVSSGPVSRLVSGSEPTWLITRHAVSELATDPAVRRVLGTARLDELLRPGQRLLSGVSARAIVDFTSAAALVQAVGGDRLPRGTAGVLYDPEAWSFTPVAEQHHPVAAARRAAAVAHAHGLRFIVAPGLDLTTVLGGRGARDRAFLRLDLVGRLARSADVIELQAQSLERDTARYRRFVRAAAAQAQAADHRVELLAGLSTNPPGAPVSVAGLRRDIAATRTTVAGYWLNIPGAGPRCPTCNPSRPEIAAQLMLRP